MTSWWHGPIFSLLLGWLLTFAVHGTVLLAGTWLVLRLVRRVPEGLQEGLWKFALVGAVVTASVQMAWIPEPAAGHMWRLQVAEGPALSAFRSEDSGPFLEKPGGLWESPDLAMAQDSAPSRAIPWQPVLVLAAGISALLGVVQRLRARHRLHRVLSRRVPLEDEGIKRRLVALAASLGYRRAVRLSSSSHLGTAIAFGVLRPEICLPSQILPRLTVAQRDAMLGHEVAHLARRDPLWLTIAGLLGSLFPWQPLFPLARTRFQELAEYRCDALAAGSVGPLSVAGCLLEVAAWMSRSREPVRPGWAMAAGGSLLRQRIDRLLVGRLPRRSIGQGLALAVVIPALALVMVVSLPGSAVTPASPPGESGGHAVSPPVRPPAEGGLAQLLGQLEGQWELLQQEVESLDRLMSQVPEDEELRALHDLLTLRLRSLEDRRARIHELVLELIVSRLPAKVDERKRGDL